jgi:hypothetical protein
MLRILNSLIAFATVFCGNSLAAGDSAAVSSGQPEKLCAWLIEGEFKQIHPDWNITELKVSHSADLAFREGDPVYHAVEVSFSVRTGPNPLSPVNWALGLFRDGRFVRLATGDEYKIFSKRVGEKG